ncbi:hypothetical protein [Gordonia sp. VNK21]|uniref:hypothetical protein n=1 Tax=Gordonia sp. VNK21 TaxID=3382483 RepID=UPI0038D3B3C0
MILVCLRYQAILSRKEPMSLPFTAEFPPIRRRLPAPNEKVVAPAATDGDDSMFTSFETWIAVLKRLAFHLSQYA